jgi:hypothetical protein
MLTSLTRRNWLRGLTLGSGAVLLSPILRELQAHADGAAKPPLRFVFVVQNHGLQSWAVKPPELSRHDKEGNDKLVERSLAELSLADDLSPLSEFKDRLSIVQGLNGRHVTPFHGGPYGALGGYRKGSVPTGRTIDCALAEAHPAVFPHLGLGVGSYSNAEYCSSAWGANRAAPVYCHPDYAFRMLFGSVLDGEDRVEFDARSSVLEFMREDVKRAQAKLAGPERERFDAYVESYETMHRRQLAVREMERQLRAAVPTRDEKYSTERETLQLQAHVELAAAALIGGLTRVVTLCSGLCKADGHYRGFNDDVINLHQDVGHGQRGTSKELYTLLRKYHLTEMANLARRLQAVPEGDGTMLDNTLFIYTSDFGETHHSQGRDWAYVLLGNLQGKLKANRYVDYPLAGREGNRSINAFYCTLLHAAGAPCDHFNLTGPVKMVDRPGPLDELLA